METVATVFFSVGVFSIGVAVGQHDREKSAPWWWAGSLFGAISVVMFILVWFPPKVEPVEVKPSAEAVALYESLLNDPAWRLGRSDAQKCLVKDMEGNRFLVVTPDGDVSLWTSVGNDCPSSPLTETFRPADRKWLAALFPVIRRKIEKRSISN